MIPDEALEATPGGECDGIGGLLGGPLALQGRLESMTPFDTSFVRSDTAATLAGQQLVLGDVDILNGDALPVEAVTWIEAAIFEGEWESATTMDSDAVQSFVGGDVLVFVELETMDPNGSDGYVKQIFGIAPDGDVEVPNVGCGDLSGLLSDMAALGGFDSGEAMLTEWATLDDPGADPEFNDLESDAYRIDG